MRKITIEKTLFNYNELSEKAKQKVKEELCEMITEDNFYFFEEDMHYILKEEYNLTNCDINYSLSYSQGDGVSFTKDCLLSYIDMKNKTNLNAFEKALLEKLDNETLEHLLNYLNAGYNYSIIRKNYHYYHAFTCDVDYEYDYSDDPCLTDAENDKIIAILRETYLSICDRLVSRGYACYEVSENDILCCIEGNEYEFLEDGSIY